MAVDARSAPTTDTTPSTVVTIIAAEMTKASHLNTSSPIMHPNSPFPDKKNEKNFWDIEAPGVEKMVF